MSELNLAIDLGTTNIEILLFDVASNKTIGRKSFHNRQSLYGMDVINRINACTKNNDNIPKLKKLACNDIYDNLNEIICKYNESNAEEVYLGDIKYAVFSGNTTMISILLEHDISTLGFSPYKHILSKSKIVNSRYIFGDDTKLNCDCLMLGCMSAFVGGDIISGCVYLEKICKEFDDKHISLFLDLGTNGEMVLNNKGKLSVTSAACGPAFESSFVKCNAFGSSLLDAICMGLKLGKIDTYGILKEEYIDSGLNIMNIKINQDILRQILLAKAAIATGIYFLCKKAFVSYEDIDKLYISGGFGFNLNMESASLLGLIPDTLCKKAYVYDNTSLFGAKSICLDKDLINKLTVYDDNSSIDVLLLANMDNYQEKLVEYMKFTQI